MKKFSGRKGFTLFHLLIVMAVITVLASAMMYASDEAIITARAADIINNLQTIRKATLAWYADHRDEYRMLNDGKKKIQFETDKILPEIASYIDSNGRGMKLNEGTANNDANDRLREGGYGIFNVWGYRTTWYAGYQFKKDEERVKAKVLARAGSAGLVFAQRWPDPRRSDWHKKARVKDLTGYESVWLHILGDFEETGWWDKGEVDDIHKHEASGDLTY